MSTFTTTKTTGRDQDRAQRPWVRPGSELAIVAELKRSGRWPASRRDGEPQRRDPKRPVATAHLVVPFQAGDLGARPVADARVEHSHGVRILDGAGIAVDQPQAGHTYRLEASVDNRGVAPAYFGLAAFYVAQPAQVVAAAAGGQPLPALGHTGFSLNAAASGVVQCPKTWSPVTDAEARASVVVHAYDPTSDMLLAPFDAHADRHVGRRDAVADFAGSWNGKISTSWGTGPFKERLIVTQSSTDVTVAFYGEVGSPPKLPNNPQMTGPGAIVGKLATGLVTEHLGGQPFTTNAWTLTLAGPDTLTFHNQRTYVVPGDTRGTQIEQGTLTR